MNTVDFRSLTTCETDILLAMFARDFPGRAELLEQLRSCSVRSIDVDGGLEFLVHSSATAMQIQHRIPVEAEYEDVDGIVVHILLHVLQGKISELEFYREDGGLVRQRPMPNQLRVFVAETAH